MENGFDQLRRMASMSRAHGFAMLDDYFNMRKRAADKAEQDDGKPKQQQAATEGGQPAAGTAEPQPATGTTKTQPAQGKPEKPAATAPAGADPSAGNPPKPPKQGFDPQAAYKYIRSGQWQTDAYEYLKQQPWWNALETNYNNNKGLYWAGAVGLTGIGALSLLKWLFGRRRASNLRRVRSSRFDDGAY